MKQKIDMDEMKNEKVESKNKNVPMAVRFNKPKDAIMVIMG